MWNFLYHKIKFWEKGDLWNSPVSSIFMQECNQCNVRCISQIKEMNNKQIIVIGSIFGFLISTQITEGIITETVFLTGASDFIGIVQVHTEAVTIC